MSDGNTTYIRYNLSVNENNSRALINTIQEELERGMEHLVLQISSTGGFCYWGFMLADFITGLPIKVTTHAFGRVESMGVVIFCAGEKRLATENTGFMIHETGFNASNNQRFQLKQLEDKIKVTKRDNEA